MMEGLNSAKWDEGVFKCAAPFAAQNLLRHHSHDCPAAPALALALLLAPDTAMWLMCSQTCSQWASQTGSDIVGGQEFEKRIDFFFEEVREKDSSWLVSGEDTGSMPAFPLVQWRR